MGSFGKKTRNPGWTSGEHWVVCDRTGKAIRESDAREEWNGLVVAKEEWEPRHPQDFLRAREDDSSPKGLVRPEASSDDYITLPDGSSASESFPWDETLRTSTLSGARWASTQKLFAVSPNKEYLYIADAENGKLIIIDYKTNEVLKEWAINIVLVFPGSYENGNIAIAAMPTEGHVAIWNGDTKAFEVYSQTSLVSTEFTTDTAVQYMYADVNGAVWAVTFGVGDGVYASGVGKVSTLSTSNQPLTSIHGEPITESATHISINTLNTSERILLFDKTTKTLVKELFGNLGNVFSPDGSKLYHSSGRLEFFYEYDIVSDTDSLITGAGYRDRVAFDNLGNPWAQRTSSLTGGTTLIRRDGASWSLVSNFFTSLTDGLEYSLEVNQDGNVCYFAADYSSNIYNQVFEAGTGTTLHQYVALAVDSYAFDAENDYIVFSTSDDVIVRNASDLSAVSSGPIAVTAQTQNYPSTVHKTVNHIVHANYNESV